jgi:hypothetical protein
VKRILGVAILFSLAGCTSLSPSSERFELKMVPISKNSETRHIKFDRFTGETWWSSNTSWLKIQETEPLPKSIYDVQFVATSDSWRCVPEVI